MPYKKIPISYEFLTQMAETIHPTLTCGKWAAVPYTEEIIETVLAHQQTLTDVGRGEWHLGPKKPGVAVNQDVFLTYPTDEEQSPAQKINSSVEKLFTASGNGLSPTEQNPLKDSGHFLNDKLSLEESRALVALSLSIGNGSVLQGGSFRGITATCFRSMWLLHEYGLTDPILQSNAYSESQRVERLRDRTLKVSSYYEARQVKTTDGTDQEIGSLTGEPIYKIYSEQHLKQGENESGDTIFTLTPHRVELQVQPIFWDALLAIAEKRLEKIDELTNSDLFTFIPLLEDFNFRAQFIRKLESQSPEIKNHAAQWIKACMPGIGFQIKYAVTAAVVNNPWKTAACIGGVILGVLGAALTATGVLAPLGVALGYAGVLVASPATAAAVGTFLGALAVGLVKSVVTLGKSIAACFKSEQPDDARHQNVANSSAMDSTARVIQAVPTQANNSGNQKKDEDEERNENSPSVITEQNIANNNDRRTEDSPSRGPKH